MEGRQGLRLSIWKDFSIFFSLLFLSGFYNLYAIEHLHLYECVPFHVHIYIYIQISNNPPCVIEFELYS